MAEKLLLATNNQGKIREIKNLLKNIPIRLVTTKDIINIPKNFNIKETGETFAENAKLKASTLGKMTKLLTLADDSGLEVDALYGEPGVRSARFAKGSDQARIKKVLQLLNKIPFEKRTARFKAVVAIYDPKTRKLITFEGQTEGKITTHPQGTRGFGYDPIFLSTELNKAFGRATLREKNRVSHRARALTKAKEFLIKRSQLSK